MKDEMKLLSAGDEKNKKVKKEKLSVSQKCANEVNKIMKKYNCTFTIRTITETDGANVIYYESRPIIRELKGSNSENNNPVQK